MTLSKIAVVLLMVAAQLQAEDPIAQYRAAAVERWEDDIQELEQLDQAETDPEHAILFIGSSSIRLWEEMAEDMAPWPTIRRGYGGAKLSDLAVYVERLIEPHQFDALVIFVANDISGKESDKTPEEVLRLYQYVIKTVRQSRADTPVFFIGITPSSSRFAVWDQIKQANALIARYCSSEPRLHYIDTADHYLTEAGKPKDALFREDQLHLNRDGYRLWAKIIKAELANVIPRE